MTKRRTALNNKSRGRKGEVEVRALLLEQASQLTDRDVVLPGGSAPGKDLILSPTASMELFGLDDVAIEVKRRKAIAALRFMDQAKCYTGVPMVYLREDRRKWHVLLQAADFFLMLNKD